MDTNNSGMNPILDGGIDKKQIYIWTTVVVLLLVVIAIWVYVGRSKNAGQEINPINNVSTPESQTVNTPANNSNITPETSFDIKG